MSSSTASSSSSSTTSRSTLLGLAAAVDENGVRGRDELGVCDGWTKRLEKPGRVEDRAAGVLDGGTNFLDEGVYY